MDRSVLDSTSLLDIFEAHFRAPTDLFCNNKYDHTHGIMAMNFSSDLNLESLIYAIDLQNIYCRRLLKGGNRMTIFDAQHGRRSMGMLLDKGGID